MGCANEHKERQPPDEHCDIGTLASAISVQLVEYEETHAIRSG